MSNTVTIVIDGGLVQSVYAADSTMRVIVLDLDIEGSDPDDPRISMDHAAVQEHVIESYGYPLKAGHRYTTMVSGL